MPHVDLSQTFLPEVALLASIKAKFDADGVHSPLIEMLAENNIDLVADTAMGVTAVASNTNYLALQKTSQELTQQRDLLMAPLAKHVSGSFQFLKKFYGTSFKTVGEWGATISNNGKITYPTDTVGMVALFTTIKAKHDSYTLTTSPLASYLKQNSISLTTDAANAAKALTTQTECDAAKTNRENESQNRNNNWSIPNNHVHKIVAFLKTMYPTNFKALGTYGITMVTSPKLVKDRTIKIPILTDKLGVKTPIGSVIQNKGVEPLTIYKGKTLGAVSYTLAPAEKAVIEKGFGVFSIQHSSAINIGILQVSPY